MTQSSIQDSAVFSTDVFNWIKTNKNRVFCWTILPLILSCFLYPITIQWLISIWSHDKPYSHGFFVPFISLYIVWVKREQLRQLPVKPCWMLGLMVVLSCCVLLLFGRVGAIMQLEVMSFYFIFPGIVLFLWGWRMLRALLFPLFYLQFMIPWVDPFLSYAYPVFRQIAAILGSWFLSFRYPVHLDRTFIYLPDISLSVVEACSGVNFFISVTAVGLLLAYLTQKSWARLGGVLIFGGGLTILANGIRVALAGIMGQEYGAAMLHGPGHIFRGWFVAQVGWVGVFFVNWLITKIPHPSKFRLYERWKKDEKHNASVMRAESGRAAFKKPYFAALVLFFLGFGIFLNFFAMPKPTYLSRDINTVPLSIGSWKGRDATWFKTEEYFPGADLEILRNYRTPSGQSVNLYIGYFSSQANDSRLVSFHARPLFEKHKVVEIAAADGESLMVNLSQPTIGSRRYSVYSWYQFSDGELNDSRMVKLRGVTDAIMKHRNNGAIVLMATPALGGNTNVRKSDDLTAFSHLVAPIIKNFFKIGS